MNKIHLLNIFYNKIKFFACIIIATKMYAACSAGEYFRDCDNCPVMTVIPIGQFLMGGDETHDHPLSTELPRHLVKIRHQFAIGKYQVTQDEWKLIMNTIGTFSKFDGNNRPVEMISWYEAYDFTINLSKMTGHHYRLPSESEWEFALRGTKNTRFFFGNNNYNILNYSWVRENSNNETHDVGSLLPNQFGIYDMMGNLAEYVQDCWHDNFLNAPKDGTAWVHNDCDDHVVRGGSWISTLEKIRSSNRMIAYSGDRDSNVGFRIARDM
jgi:formylglycine-generating enzyme required for sulfatase activity